MAVQRSQIENSLEEIISNQEGMTFQGLAVVLAKLRWPDLIATERQKDGGADALALPPDCDDGIGKALCCSLTADVSKIKHDVETIAKNFEGIQLIIFATPAKATIQKQQSQGWEAAVNALGFNLTVLSREAIITELMLPANAPLCESFLKITVQRTPTDQDVIQAIRLAAEQLTATWSSRLRGEILIDLRAHEYESNGDTPIAMRSLGDITEFLKQGRRLILQAPAGRGKTTTLIQLADALLAKSAAPFVISLPEWIQSRQPILEYLISQPMFLEAGIDAAHFAQARHTLNFVFLLNGWNEIADGDIAAAKTMLQSLERSFPSAGIIVATRTQTQKPPLPGATHLHLAPLSRTQRNDYLVRRLGSAAPGLRATIDHNENLNTLTRTPMLLAQLCAVYEADQTIPRTRMHLFSVFLELLTNTPEHTAALAGNPLQGYADHYLGELSLAMTIGGRVNLDDAAARSCVSSTVGALVANGIITQRPEPNALLDILCQHHVLIRHDFGIANLAFEHQQFQEYFAAKRAWAMLQQINATNVAADVNAFQRNFLNQPAWQEPLYMMAEFIADQVDTETNNEVTLACGRRLVELALPIDAILAADLARCCGPDVWRAVRDALSGRLRAWLQVDDPHHQSCAMAGILATGAADFRDILLPRLTDTERSVRVDTYRAGNGLRLSSLGDNWQVDVRTWEVAARVDFVSNMIHHYRDVQQIIDFALADPNTEVKREAIAAFNWESSPEETETLLSRLEPEDFALAVTTILTEHIPTSHHAAALRVLEPQLAELQDAPERLRHTLAIIPLHDAFDRNRLKDLLQALAPGSMRNNSESIEQTLRLLLPTDPVWVGRWLLARFTEGSLWGDEWSHFMADLAQADRDALAERVLGAQLSSHALDAITTIIPTIADEQFADQLFRGLCARLWDANPDDRAGYTGDMGRQLIALLRAISINLLAAAILKATAETIDPIELEAVTRILRITGHDDVDPRADLDPELQTRLRDYLNRGVDTALAQPDSSGQLKCDLATAISRIGLPEDMSQLARLMRADIQRIRQRETGGIFSHANWYVMAAQHLDPETAADLMLEFLTEFEFEDDCAKMLVKLATTSQPPTTWPGVPFRQLMREARAGRPARQFDEARRRRFAEAIRDQVHRLLEPKPTTRETRMATVRAKNLMTPLAEIDAHASTELVLRVTAIPEDRGAWKQLDAIDALLLAGAALTCDAVLPILELIREQLRQNQYLNQRDSINHRILRALPFLTPHARGIPTLREWISEFHIAGYAFEGIFRLLGETGSPEALTLLQQLAEQPNLSDRESAAWADAVAMIGSPEAHDLLMSFVDPEDHRTERFHLHRTENLAAHISEIAQGARAQRLFQLCSQPNPRDREFLAQVIGQLRSVEAITAGLSLMDDTLFPHIPRPIWRQFESTFLEHRPIANSPHTYTVHAASANQIRATLFGMSHRDPRRRQSAYSLLGQIEDWRLRYGRPPGEPRHPNIDSGLFWPVLSDTLAT